MRGVTLLAALLVTIATGPVAAPAASRTTTDLVAHEWGTFTSIADEHGRAAEWLPLSQPSVLPTFVERRSFGPKGLLSGTVRMETPVVYFYTAHDTVVTARARFRNGVITEWYPRAMVLPAAAGNAQLERPGFEGSIVWRDVKVLARGYAELPTEDTPSHYYAARETDASIVEAGAQREKFLFYRGVASFVPPISAVVAPDDAVLVSHVGHQPLGPIVLFERRGEQIAYDVRHVAGNTATFAPHPPVGPAEALFAELESILVTHGLYPREAKAMVATWKESWFEEGTRLLYIVSREMIDLVLPLDIEPAPAEVARVFVGRIELVTSVTLAEVRDALARKDHHALQKYDRFLPHILTRLTAHP